jgi:oligosaccharide repeat unit polymerase
LFILPLLVVLSLIIFDSRTGFFAAIIGTSLFVYLAIIYDERLIYGFNGLQVLSLPSIVLATFTIFLAIPSVYVCTINKTPAVIPYFSAHVLFYILFPFGLKIGGIFRKIEINRVENLKSASLHKSGFDKNFFELLITLLLFSFLILILYLSRVDEIPLFELIRNPGAYIKLAIMREKALKLLDVTIFESYLFQWQRSLILPFGIIGSLFLTITYRKAKYLILFVVYFIPGVFVNSLTLEKSPIAAIFLAIMAFYYVYKNKLSVKFVIFSIIAIFFGPILIMTFVQLGATNLFRVVYISFLYRIFLIPSEVLYMYFDVFPNIHDFLYGRSSNLFSWMYDQGTFNISNYVARIWHRNPLSTGFANANYLGNFWADFGWFGIILSTIIVGIVLHLLYWKILSAADYKKTILYVISVCILPAIFTFGFFSVNFTVLFFTSGMIVLVFFTFFFKSIMQMIFKIEI